MATWDEVGFVEDPLPASELLKEVRWSEEVETVGERIDVVELLREHRKWTDAATRRQVALLTIIGSAIALLIAGVVSWSAGSFVPLASTWAVLGPLIGAVVGYYFAPT